MSYLFKKLTAKSTVVKALIFLFLLVPLVTFAANFQIKPTLPSDSELKLLPEFCYVKLKLKFKKGNALVEKWKKLLRGNYAHIHHY